MMKNLTGFCAVVCAVVVAASSFGDTIGYWTFDDGIPGSTASTVVTPTNSPTVDGTASMWNGGTVTPAFSSERAGLRVVDGLGGPVINSGNRGSLRFVNRDVPLSQSGMAGGIVRMNDSDPLTRARNFTVEAFVKVDRDVDYPTIVGKNRADAGGTSWQMDINANGTLRVRIDSQTLGLGGGNPGFNQGFTTGANLQDGAWHHVAMSYDDATQAVEIYVDYADVGGGTAINPIVYDGEPLGVGAAVGRAFDGWIDEVRVTDSVLTPNQFLRMSGTPGTIAYWGFDDGTPPATAGAVVTTVNSPTLDGVASGYSGGPTPTFDSSGPGAAILDGIDGSVINESTASLRFVNAGGPSSKVGGVVTVVDNDPLLYLSEFTIECFVRVGAHVDWPTLVTRHRTGGTTWTLDMHNDGTLRARFDTLNHNNLTYGSTTNIEDGAWHHVALVYDGNTRAADLYCDYVDIGGARLPEHLLYIAGDLSIGDSAVDRAFDGWIDEVRLSDHVRHPDEFMRAVVPPNGSLFLIR